MPDPEPVEPDGALERGEPCQQDDLEEREVRGEKPRDPSDAGERLAGGRGVEISPVTQSHTMTAAFAPTTAYTLPPPPCVRATSSAGRTASAVES